MVGLPAGGFSGGCRGHTHVGLFEGQTLKLVDEEVGEKSAEDASRSPDEEHLSA